MKILILSCNTGEGHNSAAKAILNYLKDNDIESEMLDALLFAGQKTSKRVCNSYIASTRKPQVFNFFYKAGEFVSRIFKNKSIIYFTNALYSKKLLKYIEDNKFDAVICTHLFPAESLTYLLNKKKLAIKTAFVITDYTCIPFTEETELDYFIIPHEHLTEEFFGKGIPRNKIYPFGIPVNTHFCEKQDKETARKSVAENLLEKKENLKEHWYLIMTGSMGFGNTEELVEKILEKDEAKCEILIICGNNKQMQNNLQKRFNDKANVHPIGYTDKISLIMDACDVVLTKPGGITSTEAAVKQIAMVHTAPIPGCETRNAEFFHYHNMSYSTKDLDQQVEIAYKLCNDSEYRGKMNEAQKLNSNPNTIAQIVALLKK